VREFRRNHAVCEIPSQPPTSFIRESRLARPFRSCDWHWVFERPMSQVTSTLACVGASMFGLLNPPLGCMRAAESESERLGGRSNARSFANSIWWDVSNRMPLPMPSQPMQVSSQPAPAGTTPGSTLKPQGRETSAHQLSYAISGVLGTATKARGAGSA
jgi:hypothetical protein